MWFPQVPEAFQKLFRSWMMSWTEQVLNHVNSDRIDYTYVYVHTICKYIYIYIFNVYMNIYIYTRLPCSIHPLLAMLHQFHPLPTSCIIPVSAAHTPWDRRQLSQKFWCFQLAMERFQVPMDVNLVGSIEVRARNTLFVDATHSLRLLAFRSSCFRVRVVLGSLARFVR